MRTGARVRDLPPVAALRRAYDQIKQHKAVVTDEALTAAVAHAPAVLAASATARGGTIHVDASYDDGAQLAFALAPVEARFAPRGAKELVFAVDPPDAARDGRVADAASCIAAAVARAVWSVMLTGAEPPGPGAFVDREGQDRLRVDLRTVPSMRKLPPTHPLALVVEALAIGKITTDDGAVTLEIKLPTMPF